MEVRANRGALGALLCVLVGTGCSGTPPHSAGEGGAVVTAEASITTMPAGGFPLRFAAPDELGMDARPLLRMAEWVRDSNVPIFSILVSRRGAVVFELYTSQLTRDHAHYLMSVTKSVTSALLGAAMDRGLVGPPETSLADALPPDLFVSNEDRARFAAVTLRDVLGMSALDAQVPPHRNLPEDQRRLHDFWVSPNRTVFALSQKLLPEPGVSFQYTDITPLLAIGALEYATETTSLDFAEASLFGPMGFSNEEWMHEDLAGLDNGAYGLRLRPIDMQKFGLLYLNGGMWEGTRLLSKGWVDLSSRRGSRAPLRSKSPITAGTGGPRTSRRPSAPTWLEVGGGSGSPSFPSGTWS